MEAFVTGLHVILCLFLILVVLLQPGKGADFGAMMGGTTQSQGSAAQGATLIGKLTAVVAALFMVTSMALAWFSNQGQTSVITDEALEEERAEQETENPSEEPAIEEEVEAVPDTPEAGGEKSAGDDAPAGEGEAPDGEGEAPDGESEAPAGEGEAPAGESEAPAGEGEAPAGDAGESTE